MAHLVELSPYNPSDLGLILTSCAVCLEFACSLSDYVIASMCSGFLGAGW